MINNGFLCRPGAAIGLWSAAASAFTSVRAAENPKRCRAPQSPPWRDFATSGAGVLACLVWLSATNFQLFTAFAQGTAFTYQGRLNDTGQPANGTYDLRFTIYDSTNLPGNVIAGPVTNSAGVSNGLFAVTLDFGAGVFTGPARFLEIGVRTNGAAAFAILSPRQDLTPTPYAIFAAGASNVSGVVPNASLSGTYTGAVSFSNPSNQFTGAFTGNGAGLTNVNAASLGGLGANNFWQTAGNAGTTAGPNFVGTTDNQPLELHVNGQRAFRLEPTATNAVVNVVGGSGVNSVGPGVVGAIIGGGGSPLFEGNPAPNLVESSFSTIAGGVRNGIGPNSDESAIVGGIANAIHSSVLRGTLGGGGLNALQSMASYSVIPGGEANVIGTNAYYSAIGGGGNNSVQFNAPCSTIAGGQGNQVVAPGSFIGGGGFDGSSSEGNLAAGNASIVGGGLGNSIQANSPYAAIVGGQLNSIQAGGTNCFLGGGQQNTIQSSATYSFLGAGQQNSLGVLGSYATTVGGWRNTNNGQYGFIGGGYNNSLQNNSVGAVIVGGGNQTIGTSYASIGGGADHAIQSNSSYAGIGSGFANTIQSNAAYSFLGGGQQNSIKAGAVNAFLGGGFMNAIGTNCTSSVIGGGYSNLIQADTTNAVIGGGLNNTNGATYGTISGGYYNMAQTNTQYSVIAGGGENVILSSAQSAVISGGLNNINGANFGTIGGGADNTIQTNTQASIIAGGAANLIVSEATDAFIGGGANNAIGRLGSGATIGGGAFNVASNQYATIPGGGGNVASGFASFAAGLLAYAQQDNTFVWNGFLNPARSFLPGRFYVFGTNGFSVDYYQQRADGGGVHWVEIGPQFAGQTISTWTGAFLTDGGIWQNASDRNRKTDFGPVDSCRVLQKVATLPVQSWRYTNETDTVRHIGPTAQDFMAAFGLGTDDKSIGTLDESGVALAAIQGLNQKLEEHAKEKDAEIQELKQRLRALENLIHTTTAKQEGSGL